jgi:ATP-dependent DNA helicase DinG
LAAANPVVVPSQRSGVPKAVLGFREGSVRVLRTKPDQGIIVIFDPRVSTKPYGRRFLDGLPGCEVVDS